MKRKMPKHRWVVAHHYKNVWYEVDTFLTRQPARNYYNLLKQNAYPLQLSLTIHHYILTPYEKIN